MVGVEEAKQGRSKSLSSRLMGEMIGHVPDHLLCQILSHLPTKDVVKTSVLSTRWRSLWLLVHRLELNSRDFPNFNAFRSFGDRFFDSSRVSCIDKVKLITDEYDASYLTSWIDNLVKRKIQSLNVRHCHRGTYFQKIPLSLYFSETLVSLKLYRLSLVNPKFVSLPCLKKMHLECIYYPNEVTFESLVSCSPVLEDLIIDVILNDAKVYRVHSLSLKKLTFVRSSSSSSSSSMLDSVPGVVIDAPLLSCLSIYDSVSESFIVKKLDSNAKLDISFLFGSRGYDETSISSSINSIRSFLPGISRVIDMTISTDTIKVINEYLKLEPLLQFGYMSRLRVTLCKSDSKLLLTFLESCPNLKSLILICYGDYGEMSFEDINEISFSSVPQCLLSSLEFIEFKNAIRGRYAEEMKLVRYFLKNSAILKKLTLPLPFSSTKYEIFKELLRIPRGSAKCEVVVFDR